MARMTVFFLSLVLLAACGRSVDSKGEKKADGNNGGSDSNNGESMNNGESTNNQSVNNQSTNNRSTNNQSTNNQPMNNTSGSCGDGTLDAGELCDPGIGVGSAGACPVSCQAPACTTALLTGSAASCTAQCVTQPVACGAGDGCCPAGCDASSDAECTNTCGDGVVDEPETCDGDCPTSCEDGNACTADTLVGSAASCNVQCSSQPIAACQSGDGCCPSGCTSTNDNDCECVPRTCTQAGAECGAIDDGCGGTVQCPDLCTGSETCEQARCVAPDSYIGEPCTDYPECGSSAEAACLLAPDWPNGYCSLLCNSTPCPSGSHCVQFDSQDKLCMLDCSGDASCATGYECRNWDAAGARECVPPEGSSDTSDVGGPCATDSDCASGYVCYTSIDSGQTTFPGGSCSQACFPGFIACPTAEGVCTSGGYCASPCTSSADCRSGYSCTYEVAAATSACTPN